MSEDPIANAGAEVKEQLGGRTRGFYSSEVPTRRALERRQNGDQRVCGWRGKDGKVDEGCSRALLRRPRKGGKALCLSLREERWRGQLYERAKVYRERTEERKKERKRGGKEETSTHLDSTQNSFNSSASAEYAATATALSQQETT